MKLHIETIKPPSATKNEDIIYRIDIKDDLNFKNAEEFKFIISSLINGGVKKIIIDINDLKEIDSMGIGSFIALKKSLPDENLNIIITRGSDQIMTLFKPINLDQIIKIFPTIDAGVNYLSSIK